MHKIITHAGAAHRDDFAACCLLLSDSREGIQGIETIERRDPTPAELKDPEVFVVDIGMDHNPSLNNYDHHQLNPNDEPPYCGLSLVLKDFFGVYEAAHKAMPTLRFTEVLDVRGPGKLAEELGMTREQLMGSLSPVENAVLAQFGANTTITSWDPLFVLMQSIGKDLLEYIEAFRARRAMLAETIRIERMEGYPYRVMLLLVPGLEKPSLALDSYRAERADQDIAVSVTPDDRGPGWTLYRYDDDPRINFFLLDGDERIEFAAKGGFIAKTKEPLDEPEILELLEKATCVPSS